MSSRGRLVIVRGPFGCGKTTMAQSLQLEHEREKPELLRGIVCSSDEFRADSSGAIRDGDDARAQAWNRFRVEYALVRENERET